ncbi:glycoside hydrolase family 28 protein [Sphingobium limneticum]|uniref:Glycoside hydrolase family 28 protein n=2 Tax=Sphingomonadaceae TaxID=41297 RepID=A0A5J5IA85_9SPHN|nr:glycoside hydrolase family 28 protein [Sphingobium limneticum]KAA9020476.1 glycoside hydrolase family 28 protein [Sphingobium limneticum]KAA9021519.1 glycoside hydrolase family 28 protein [Sphingobium limneticum]KAA9033881.1 glycoside hydrolase family 28 protein [Sphingobium limneticum]
MAGALSLLSLRPGWAATSLDDVEAKARAIANAIQPPRIPHRRFPIAAFGAVSDGRTDDSGAIARAIAACAAAGGGRIIVPRGVTLTGPIRLESRMELHVAKGARLTFIPDPARYLPPVHTRWEGVELMGYQPLIHAFEAEDIALTGDGVIDGSADDRTWWPWKGPWAGRYGDTPDKERQAADRARLFDMAERGVPVAERIFGEGSRLRPSFFQPYRCRRVLMEGIRVEAAPFWQVHPVECTDVTFRRVTCASHGPNNDGIDPESCNGVLIEQCVFDTGDDCIAIKAARNADGRRLGKPCENIVIRHCLMKDGHAGVAIGSELTGGVRNVFIHDCRMDSPNLTRALIIKSNSYRGGLIDHIHLRRIQAGAVDKAFIQIWMLYEEGDGGGHVPQVAHVSARDCVIGSTERVLIVRGLPDAPIHDLRLVNIRVGREAKPSVTVDVDPPTLDNVVVGGRRWTQDYLRSLPGADSISCDKWAVCR